MLEKRKRISKKEMKQDTLVTSYYKAYNFFIENQVKILIGVGVVALVIVAVVLFSNKNANDNKTANELLSKIMPVYNSGQYQQAIDGVKATNTIGLKEIVDNYGSTDAGETAKILLANSYLGVNKTEEALENFKDYSGSNDLFKATALAGQAAYFEAQKEYKNAAELYKQAANVTNVNPANADYLLRAGINFLKADQKEEAKVILKSVKKDYRATTAAQEVDKYLIQVES